MSGRHSRSSRLAGVLRPLVGAAVGMALALALGLSAAAGEAPFDEYEVKAACLYNFAKFVDWPESAFAGHPDSHRFCVYGKDPFGPSLALVLGGKTVHERKIVLERPARPEELAACQLVFLGGADKARLHQVTAAIAGHPVLLVGEQRGFLDEGGMIQVSIQGTHAAFAINFKAAEAAGLHVSSKLMSLARPSL